MLVCKTRHWNLTENYFRCKKPFACLVKKGSIPGKIFPKKWISCKRDLWALQGPICRWFSFLCFHFCRCSKKTFTKGWVNLPTVAQDLPRVVFMGTSLHWFSAFLAVLAGVGCTPDDCLELQSSCLIFFLSLANCSAINC